MAWSLGVARALPVTFFRLARQHTAHLVELMADDAASHRAGRLSLAGALLTVASGPAAEAGLAVGGPGSARRVRRMLAPASPLGAGRNLAAAVLAGSVALAPLALAATPVLDTMSMASCPPAGKSPPACTS